MLPRQRTRYSARSGRVFGSTHEIQVIAQAPGDVGSQLLGAEPSALIASVQAERWHAHRGDYGAYVLTRSLDGFCWQQRDTAVADTSEVAAVSVGIVKEICSI